MSYKWQMKRKTKNARRIVTREIHEMMKEVNNVMRYLGLLRVKRHVWKLFEATYTNLFGMCSYELFLFYLVKMELVEWKLDDSGIFNNVQISRWGEVIWRRERWMTGGGVGEESRGHEGEMNGA